MNLQDLPAPIRKIALLGDIYDGEKWPDYHELGITKKHIPVLIEILKHILEFTIPPAGSILPESNPPISDTSSPVSSLVAEDEEDEESTQGPEAWLPMHAWRALGQMQAVQALPELLNLLPLIESEEADVIQEELPQVFHDLGPQVVPDLAAYLSDAQQDMWSRLAVAEGLQLIASDHADARAQVIDALTCTLEGYAAEDATFNAFLIEYLANLKAVEAAALVEEAYRADRVDESVLGDWEDFQIAVGLLDKRLTPSGFNLTSDYPAGMLSEGGHKTKEDKKTKKKRKIEKEARKKNRKRKKR